MKKTILYILVCISVPYICPASGCLLHLDYEHVEAGPDLQLGPAREQEVAEGVRGQGERGIQVMQDTIEDPALTENMWTVKYTTTWLNAQPLKVCADKNNPTQKRKKLHH